MAKTLTQVTNVDSTLDEIIRGEQGIEQSSDSSKETKTSLFTPEQKTDDVINQAIKDKEDGDDKDKDDKDKPGSNDADNKDKDQSKEELNKIINNTILDKSDDEPEGKAGPFGLFTKKLIEEGVLLGYEDEDDKIENYTEKEFKELLVDNIQNGVTEEVEKYIQGFWQGMPNEFQKAYAYIQNGGKDIVSFMSSLADQKKVEDLKIDTVENQRKVVRQYLKAKDFGTEEEIEDELEDYEASGRLEKKATTYYDKLKDIIEEKNAKLLKEQENTKKTLDEQRKVFDEELRTNLGAEKLNGVPISKETRNMIYNGFTNNNYNVNGQKTNEFFSLVDKVSKQKNKGVLLEAYWLLKDPLSYRKAVVEEIKKAVTEETLKKVKSEQHNLASASATPNQQKKTIQKQQRHTMFQRN